MICTRYTHTHTQYTHTCIPPVDTYRLTLYFHFLHHNPEVVDDVPTHFLHVGQQHKHLLRWRAYEAAQQLLHAALGLNGGELAEGQLIQLTEHNLTEKFTCLLGDNSARVVGGQVMNEGGGTCEAEQFGRGTLLDVPTQQNKILYGKIH